MSDCQKCQHPWVEHRTTVSAPDEHECMVDTSYIAAPLLVCGCMEIPPGHAPDWEVCAPCRDLVVPPPSAAAQPQPERGPTPGTATTEEGTSWN